MQMLRARMGDQKFLALLDFFRKYGDQYQVDYLLMAAQGFQESGLNQDAKSAVGAVGVMQVMPATGKELKVGDINVTEPNLEMVFLHLTGRALRE